MRLEKISTATSNSYSLILRRSGVIKLSSLALCMTQAAALSVLLSKVRIFTLTSYKVNSLFSVILHGLFHSAAFLFSIPLSLCPSSSRILPVPSPLQGSFATAVPVAVSASSWFLFSSDLQHFQTAAEKSSLHLCFCLPLSPTLTSFISVWVVFTEHRTPTEKCRMNSAHDTNGDNLTLNFFSINVLSQNNHTIMRSLKNISNN